MTYQRGFIINNFVIGGFSSLSTFSLDGRYTIHDTRTTIHDSNKGTHMTQNEKTTEKSKSVLLALSSIERQFGKGSIMRLGDAGSKLNNTDVSVVSTGCLSLDMALGIGGLP